MKEERIKELALKLTDKIYDLLPIDNWGRRSWEFQYRKELQTEIEKYFRTVAAEAREEGRKEGIDEMRDAVKQKIWDILHARKILARLLVLRTSEEAERLKEKGK